MIALLQRGILLENIRKDLLWCLEVQQCCCGLQDPPRKTKNRAVQKGEQDRFSGSSGFRTVRDDLRASTESSTGQQLSHGKEPVRIQS